MYSTQHLTELLCQHCRVCPITQQTRHDFLMKNNKKCSSIIKVFISVCMAKKTYKWKYHFLHVTYTKYFGFLIISPATPIPCLEHCLTTVLYFFRHDGIQNPHYCATHSYGLGLENKYLLFTECIKQFSLSRNKFFLHILYLDLFRKKQKDCETLIFECGNVNKTDGTQCEEGD